MDKLGEIWPFSQGHQELMFFVMGVALFGLLVLNISIAVIQKLPPKQILSSFFSEVNETSRIQKILRIVLLTCLAVTFFVLVIDIAVNGNQLVRHAL